MATRTVVLSALLATSCLSFSGAAMATTWHVPLDAPTIQAGIDSATAGDTVLVACGTYNEHDIVIKSGVKLLSETGLPDCVTIDAQGLGLIFRSIGTDATTLIRGFTITGGASTSMGAGMYCELSSLTVENCDFTGNSSIGNGGGMTLYNASATIQDCNFYGNYCLNGGAGADCWSDASTITRCTFSYNDCPNSSMGTLIIASGTTSVSYVTLAFNNNAGGYNGGAILSAYATPVISNTIVAFNSGAIGINGRGSAPTISCTNSFGNPGGDWGGVADQLGVSGNISLDPLFCDGASGDYHLASTSPCLDWSSGCGDMGAYGMGCIGEQPVFISLGDVPNDQGRQVRLQWLRSGWDAPGDTVDVESYEVYRYQGAFAAARPAPDGDPSLVEGWDFIASAPAHGDSIYQLVAPTLCDSTIVSGQCWSQFFVRATTTDRFLYYDSAVDSGYSVDNLAPGVPAAFAVAYGPAGGNTLTWEAVPDADFQYYKVYRDTEAGFTPSPANLVHTTIDLEWLDAGGDQADTYMISAVDHAGNEGEATGPGTVTGVTRDLLPDTYALYQNAPNPFNPTTTIRYDLPEASPVTLVIYDVSGRRVRVLKGGAVEPRGRRSVMWDGTSDAGTRVASGVYFYRLEAGAFTSTRRMVLLQ